MVEQPALIHILAQTGLFTDGKVYLILKLGLAHGESIASGFEAWSVPFWACIRDKDEVTLVLAQEAVQRIPAPITIQDVSPPYRLITFDISLDWSVTGYLAALASVLAGAGISLFALSAFSRDHIFVAETDFDRAWEVLDAFIHTCRVQVAGCEIDEESV